MDHIVAIIDGTGDFSDRDYAIGMRHAFCVQIAEGSGLYVKGPEARSSRAYYQRGPSLDGASTYSRGQSAFEFLHSGHRFFPKAKLVIAGYSRGGSSAVYAATALERLDIEVDAMFLFDPVARQALPGGEVVPKNVKQLWVASREYDPALVSKYDGRFSKMGKAIGNSPVFQAIAPVPHALITVASKLTSDWMHPMRPGFGKTAEAYLGDAGNHMRRQFRGSHGALGGVGWKNVDEDADCQQEVAAWMTGGMGLAGFPMLLRSHPPTQIWT